MLIKETTIKDLLILEPKVHGDHRGFFLEAWREDLFLDLNMPKFVQDNHAFSASKGVFRGMHFQKNPMAQSKFVWVTRGAVLDIVCDIRTNSSTYGTFFAQKLSAENHVRLFVPQGFAHGYITLEENTDFHYKVDNYYSHEDEGGFSGNTKQVQDFIKEYYKGDLIQSEKDLLLPLFEDFKSPF